METSTSFQTNDEVVIIDEQKIGHILKCLKSNETSNTYLVKLCNDEVNEVFEENLMLVTKLAKQKVMSNAPENYGLFWKKMIDPKTSIKNILFFSVSLLRNSNRI